MTVPAPKLDTVRFNNPGKPIHPFPAVNPVGTIADTPKIELVRLSIADWDVLCMSFEDLVLEQTGTFMAARWGENNVECIGFKREGIFIGGCAVIVSGIPLVGTGIAIVKWGPLFCRDDNANREPNLEIILKGLIEEFCRRRGFQLTIMPVACPNNSGIIERVLRRLHFLPGKKLPAPLRYFVDTRSTEAALLASFDQKWRYNLRKALKNDLEIGFEDTPQGLEIFRSLYDNMLERKCFHDSSAIDALPELINNLPETIKPRIVLARHEGEVTAGGVFFVGAPTASYVFGATDHRALSLKAGYAMQWWVARQLCAVRKTEWLDLGGNDLDSGLHQYKKGMVGKSGLILDTPPRYHIASTLAGTVFGGTVFTLKDAHAVITRRFHYLKYER